MTTNLHDKMLAALDAYFSASDAVEEEVAENLLLDVRDEINKHKLAADSLTEGLRLDDWPKIGCVNHDCDKCKALAQQPAQPQPLTDEVTDRCIEAADTRWADAFVPIQWARHFKNAIEAAHGITKGTA